MNKNYRFIQKIENEVLKKISFLDKNFLKIPEAKEMRNRKLKSPK